MDWIPADPESWRLQWPGQGTYYENYHLMSPNVAFYFDIDNSDGWTDNFHDRAYAIDEHVQEAYTRLRSSFNAYSEPYDGDGQVDRWDIDSYREDLDTLKEPIARIEQEINLLEEDLQMIMYSSEYKATPTDRETLGPALRLVEEWEDTLASLKSTIRREQKQLGRDTQGS